MHIFTFMLIKIILQCILGLGVGLYGYLVPGYINLSILQLGIDKNKKAIWQTLLIISIIEIPYCYFCMSGMQWIMEQHLFLLIIKWLLVVFLFALSIFTFLYANKTHKLNVVETKNLDTRQINKLILFAVFNPFQISAWAIWGTYFIEKTWFNWTPLSILIFSFGASIGVFIMLWLYANIGTKILSYFSLNRKSIDYIICGILLLLAVLQLTRNLQ